MDLQNRCALSTTAFLANPTGVRVPVGACYVTSDSCRISVQSWLYLGQDYATKREVAQVTSYGQYLGAQCVIHIAHAREASWELLLKFPTINSHLRL